MRRDRNGEDGDDDDDDAEALRNAMITQVTTIGVMTMRMTVGMTMRMDDLSWKRLRCLQVVVARGKQSIRRALLGAGEPCSFSRRAMLIPH